MDMLSYLLGKKAGGKTASVVVVDELPDTGEPNVIYLVPKEGTGQNDIFDEYIWVENDWELIGTTNIDLSNYLAKDNTTSYTPSGDYNPSTKKYVDDAVNPLKFCIGKITDYNSSSKALNLDDLEEGKTYTIINDLDPVANGTDLYIKVTSDTYGVIQTHTALAYNKLKTPIYYICKHKHTETLEDQSTRTYYAQLYFEALILDYFSDYTIKNTLYEYYEIETGGGALTTQTTTNKIYAVNTNQAQSISGVKTFTSLPESSVTPTTNNQLVNKSYVDTTISTAITDALGGSY